MQQSIDLSRQKKHFSALIYIDLDRFKIVNDSLGYAVGDSLLQEIAIKLLNAVGEADIVARLSGDEFVVLLHGERDDHCRELRPLGLVDRDGVCEGDLVQITVFVNDIPTVEFDDEFALDHGVHSGGWLRWTHGYARHLRCF